MAWRWWWNEKGVNVRALGLSFGSLFAFTEKKRVELGVRWLVSVNNALRLTEGEEVPSVRVEEIDAHSFRVSLRVVSDLHEKLSHFAPAISGSLRGKLSKYEARPGVDVDGGNWVQYEVFDSQYSYQFRPQSYRDFRRVKRGVYKLDNRLNLNLAKSANVVISGSVGTGKSVLGLMLLAEMLTDYGKPKAKGQRGEKPDVFVLDGKAGELMRLAQLALPSDHYAGLGSSNGMTPLRVLEKVIEIQKQRQEEMLHSHTVTVDSARLGHAPVVLIADEMGAMISTMPNTKRKDADGNSLPGERDAFVQLYKALALTSRSAFIELITLSQQASVQGLGLDTSVISQFSHKFALGSMTGSELSFLMPGFAADLPVKAWEKHSGRGFYYADNLLAPMEIVGPYPDVSGDAGEWLFTYLIKKLRKIYEIKP